MTPRRRRATFVTQLDLLDVKSFAGEQYLDLTDENGNPARWTLLLGNNGVGKTTLLECLTQLSPHFNSDTGAGEKDPLVYLEPRIAFASNDAIFSLRRNDAPACMMQATFVANSILDHATGPEELETSISFKYENGKNERVQSSRWAPGGKEELLESEWDKQSKLQPPLVLTYGAGRHMGIGNFDLDNVPESTDSLLEGDAELFDAEELLLYLHHASLAESAVTARRQKELLVGTIAAFLPEVGAAKDIVIQGATAIGEKTKMGVMVRTRDGLVPLKQLSFGYQTMMAWIGDIAMRLFSENPTSKNPLHFPAIVIVDEIDLHLHPHWQRQIRELLTAHFPNVQFIATAHSPLMAQAFLDANLAVVTRDGDHSIIENDPAAIINWRIDQIVTSDLFGLGSPWPPSVDELFAEQARLSGKAQRSKTESTRLRTIEKQMLDLPTEDSPEDDAALHTIRDIARNLSRQG